MTLRIIILVAGTLLILWFSRKPLRSPRSHGFYRTFAWETILILIILNLESWFQDPFRWTQIISWVLLLASLLFVIEGVRLLRVAGKTEPEREGSSLIGLEKTTKLVTGGIYAWIRHPLYSSLFLLAWGAFLKRLSWTAGCLAVVATVFLLITARIEEEENIAYFGREYQIYIKNTKMFIPLLF